MRPMLAFIAIVATSAIPAVAAGTHDANRLMIHAARPEPHLTAKQKLWFGRAVAHILRGDR